MPEITQCPSCLRKLNVPDGHLGMAFCCPACGHQFIAGFGRLLHRSLTATGGRSLSEMRDRSLVERNHLRVL